MALKKALIGVMPGDTVDLNLTFPESYSRNQDLAGQAVVFTVTVQNILESTDYENVTPEQLELMGLEYKTKGSSVGCSQEECRRRGQRTITRPISIMPFWISW